jgi:N-acetylneuraminic acid mutarotase
LHCVIETNSYFWLKTNHLMKHKLTLLVCLTFLIHSAFSQQYHWAQMASFPGGNRYAPVGFSVGNFGYAGLGIDIINGNVIYKNDFWKYDPQLNTWTQLSNFPGTMRHGATSFIYNNKAYVTTGWFNATQLKDLWEYNPSTDTWSQLTNFGGSARYMPSSFVIGNNAYVGEGYSPYKNDYWAYNFQNNNWAQVANISRTPVQGARCFSINGFGYVYGGANINANPTFINQLWQYDPVTDAWTQKTSSPGVGRQAGAAFLIQGKAFIGMGLSAGSLQDCYIYDPATDSWTQTANFGGGPRHEGICFSINDIGFAGLGANGVLPGGQIKNDFWAFGPEPSPFSIIGSAGFCRPSSNNIYSVSLPQAGVIYNWIVPAGATITSGQGTSSITVSFASNAVAGNITVTLTNAFGSSLASKSIVIRSGISSTPGSITGSNIGCNGDAKLYTIKKVNNADYYIWTPPTGATINGSSAAFTTGDTGVVVTYGASFTGDSLRVRSGNCKGVSNERKLRINKTNPSTPGSIAGLNVGLCNLSGVTYFINAVNNATSYTWRTNIAGATINGNASPVTATSTSVTVNFGTFITGQIYVKANNGCGSSGERSLTVNAKPAVPSSITGTVTLCTNQTGNNYSTIAVSNASSYNWTVPSGSMITTGQGTTAIIMKAGANPGSGNVRVRSQNACANSAYLSKAVTISNCPRMEDGNNLNNELYIEAYPNPVSDILYMSIESSSSEAINITITDMEGRKVKSWKEEITEGKNIIETSVNELPSGIYIITALSSEGNYYRLKITVN